MDDERRACRTLGQHRSTQRKVPQGRADEQRLTDDIIELADQYGRYGYRMVAGLLNNAGWCVNPKRVERRDLVRHWSENNGERRLKRMYAKMGKNFTEAEIQQLNLSFADGKLKQVN